MGIVSTIGKGIKGFFGILWKILTQHIWIVFLIIAIIMWYVAYGMIGNMADFGAIFKEIGTIIGLSIGGLIVIFIGFKIHSAMMKTHTANSQKKQADAQLKMAEAMNKQMEGKNK